MAFDAFFLTHKNDADTKARLEKVKEQIPTVQLCRIQKDTWEHNTIADAIFELSGLLTPML